MELHLLEERKKKKRLFLVVYIITVLLIILVFTAFFIPVPTHVGKDKTSIKPTFSDRKQLDLLDVLNKKWTYLMDVEEKTHAKGNVSREQLLATQKVFEIAENDCKKLIDSIQIASSKLPADEKRKSLELAILSFKNALEVSHQQNEFTISETNDTARTATLSAPEEQLNTSEIKKLPVQLAEAQNRIKVKDRQIRELENQLTSSMNSVKDNTTIENNRKLEKENDFLKWALRSQVSDLKKLTEMNDALKQKNN